jgi:hypothetical protein
MAYESMAHVAAQQFPDRSFRLKQDDIDQTRSRHANYPNLSAGRRFGKVRSQKEVNPACPFAGGD